jgi:hypothetical protein
MHMVGADGLTSNIIVTGTWTRIPITANGTGGTTSYAIGLRGGQTPANSNTADILVWGADLRTGSSAGTYQRIAAATDYATAGFLPYLYFITDDSFSTGSIDFTATDKMFVCTGVTKLSDNVAYTVICELSADLSMNAGSFVLAPNVGTYEMFSKGTLQASASASGYTAPVTNVVTGTGNIAGDSVVLRVNGSQVATSSANQGTGNFGNYPLYIGRRANTSLPFNGNFYQLIVCGKTLSASELASTESFVAAKTGVAI